MNIIAVLNRKGGCGKTTIALNLAAVLQEQGHRALVIDLDPQQSATRWASQCKEGNGKGFDLRTGVVPLKLDRGAARFKIELTASAQKVRADMVLLDSPPELRDPAMVAALLADLVLVPVTPSPLDFWAAETAVQMAREARKERGGKLPRISLVPSKLIAGTVLAREIAGTLEALGEPVAPGITQRVALVEAAVAGQTICSYAPRSPVHAEFVELANHVSERMHKVVKA